MIDPSAFFKMLNEKGIDLNRYIWNKKFNYFSKIDKIITNAFPRLFAMQRKIVLVKT